MEASWHYIVVCAVFVTSWGLTAWVRRYALQGRLMDIPNQRSSHAVPTPRGGGIAIVVSWNLALGVLWWLGVVRDELAGAGLAALGVAAIGLWDDYRSLSARIRLLVHFICAAVVVWLLPLNITPLALNTAASVLLVVALVWLLNLYNFMDGIDGLAGGQALSVALGFALLAALVGFNELMWLALILAMAAGGFLCWNWPSAKIFMGDVGSGYLGILFGVLLLLAWQHSAMLAAAGVILMGAFVVDATWTLITRMLTGQRFMAPHRTHVYQKLSDRWRSHTRVSVALLVVNTCWLLPLAYAVAFSYLQPLFGLLIAYAPFCALAIGLRAGVPPKEAVTC